MEMELLRDDDVLAKLDDEAFCRDWGALRAHAGALGCIFSAPEPRSWINTVSERAQESLNGKTRRNLMNRLKRVGEVRLEIAQDVERMEALLDEHIHQCDLRQAAMYD